MQEKLFVRELSKESSTKDWKKAVEEGVQILVDANKVKIELKDEILKTFEKFGAYHILEKGIALLHAPPGDYVKESSVSLLLLDQNIQFNNEDKWARCILTLASNNSSSHINLIREFGNIFSKDLIKNKLINAKDLNEFYEIYNNFLNKKKGGV